MKKPPSIYRRPSLSETLSASSYIRHRKRRHFLADVHVSSQTTQINVMYNSVTVTHDTQSLFLKNVTSR